MLNYFFRKTGKAVSWGKLKKKREEEERTEQTDKKQRKRRDAVRDGLIIAMPNVLHDGLSFSLS